MKKLLTLLAGSTLALYMQGCSDNGTSANDDKPVSKGSVYVHCSKYPAGELRWVDEDGKLSKDTLSFYNDSKIVGVDGNLFVLERMYADNLVLVDPTTNERKWTQSLDDLANPSDVVKANDDEVWVALDGVSKLIKVAVKDGKVKKTVKTKDFAQGEEGTPHLVDLETRNDTLFALFGRYVVDGYNSTYPAKGLLAMYKLDDGELLDTIKLAAKNPQAMGFAKGKLYVASVGAYNPETYGYDSDDAGIEAVDLDKKKSSLIVDGKKLGGGVWAFAVNAKEGKAYVGVYKTWSDLPLAEVDLSEKTVKSIKGITAIHGSLFFDDATETLYIGNEDYLYTYEDGELNKVENASKDALPPYNITVVR